jgi:polygalacturonase
MNLYYFCGPKGKDKYVWDKDPYPVTEETPRFRRIHFANITARNVNATAGFIYGLSEQPVTDVSFQNINISMAEHALPGKPAMMAGLEKTAKSGFYIGSAENISFDHVIIDDVEGESYHVENCKDLSWNSCKVNGKLVEQNG